MFRFADKFQNYYKDVSERVKNREVDILLVVNMFLTGFDATTLNTLWVDKNLRLHGLLQAFSRTNRILNTVKTFGNIVCFRNLEQATNESIALFGEKEDINDDLFFEMELIKQIEINIDYILELVKKYHEDHTKNRKSVLNKLIHFFERFFDISGGKI